MPAHSTPTAEFFTDTWSIYEQVLLNNYMFHKEIYEEIETLLAARFGDRRFSILDLGCGDAGYLARALRGRSVSTYQGYDLSAPALANAAQNLRPLGAELKLCEGDLLAGIQSVEQGVDLIFTSFALHHLTTDAKRAFFQAASARLNDGGILLMIDVVRNEDEDLPLYLERYCEWLRNRWTSLPASARDAVCDHILHNDMPETASTLFGLADQAGLASNRQVNDFNRHRTLCFEQGLGKHPNRFSAQPIGRTPSAFPL